MSFFDDDSFFSEPKTPNAQVILRVRANDYRLVENEIHEIAMVAFDPSTGQGVAEFERRGPVTNIGLMEIANWLDETAAPRAERVIWSRYAWFDPVLLSVLFDRCGKAVPWLYNNQRDLNTLMQSRGDPGPSERFGSALDECRWTRATVIKTLRYVQ